MRPLGFVASGSLRERSDKRYAAGHHTAAQQDCQNGRVYTFAGREGPRERSHKARCFLGGDLLFLTDAQISDGRGRALKSALQAIRFSEVERGDWTWDWERGRAGAAQVLHSGGTSRRRRGSRRLTSGGGGGEDEALEREGKGGS